MLDFTPWNTLLQTYVDDQGRVDYARWQQQAQPELETWLASLPNSLDGLAPEDSLALLINLYNFNQPLQRPHHSAGAEALPYRVSVAAGVGAAQLAGLLALF
ncbi:hypothetical protein [Leptolyngbya sp. KIOST-1]|uniref:hypothetical protein n=1 Tax=Leptolyngbya sp. KIOST-1 TaxID=1229172 RepID=UPI000A46D92A|nr:hypothetical protein [Leptolyngbya sp. KIOST-1]